MKDQDGFTLVEVLVSFTILSLLLIFSFGAFGDGLRRLSRAEDARNRIDQATQLLSQIEAGVGLAEFKGFRVIRQRLGNVDQLYGRSAVLIRIFDGENNEPLLETIIVERVP